MDIFYNNRGTKYKYNALQHHMWRYNTEVARRNYKSEGRNGRGEILVRCLLEINTFFSMKKHRWQDFICNTKGIFRNVIVLNQFSTSSYYRVMISHITHI